MSFFLDLLRSWLSRWGVQSELESSEWGLAATGWCFLFQTGIDLPRRAHYLFRWTFSILHVWYGWLSKAKFKVQSPGAQGFPGRVRFVPQSRISVSGAAGLGVRVCDSAGSVWQIGAALKRFYSLSRIIGADGTRGGFALSLSAGSRTTLTPLQFFSRNALRIESEKSWLGSDNKQPCFGIKLESGDLPWRFFMIDEIDHVSKKRSSNCQIESVRMRWFLRGCLPLKLPWPGFELRMRMLKRPEPCQFSSGVGPCRMATALEQVNAVSRCFPHRRNDQISREVEQMRQTEVETNYDSGKQTWRSSLAIDERWCWWLGLNSIWRLRCTSQRIVSAFLFVSATTKARE